MKAFNNYSKQVRSTPNEIVREYFLPLLAEFGILILCMFSFRMVKRVDVLIQEPSLVGDDLTNPTLGRLVYASFVRIQLDGALCDGRDVSLC